MLAQFTGWTEPYIQWHLPLARGWAYFHAARMLAGEKRNWAALSKAELAEEAARDAFIDRFRPA